MPTRDELRLLQALPLELKIEKTKARIREWVNYYGMDGVYVSFSGGKDSTVLLDVARSIYPNLKAVFSDTGLEYPEIRNFVKQFGNVDWVKPKRTFREIVIKRGYPVFGKEIAESIWFARKIVGGGLYQQITRQTQWKETIHKRQELTHSRIAGARSCKGFLDGQAEGNKSIYNKEKYLPACQELPFIISGFCCNEMKKTPTKAYGKKTGRVPIVGTTTEESMLRMQGWLRTGCNAFESSSPKSQPLSFWLEQDILQYIKQEHLEICSVYGEITNTTKDGQLCIDGCGKLRCTGCQRTGCAYCLFGAGNEHRRYGKSRFEILGELHPEIYDYVMRGGEWADNPYYDATAKKVEDDGWVNWNPKKIWQPSINGLGMKFVIDEVNKLYGKDFIKY